MWVELNFRLAFGRMPRMTELSKRLAKYYVGYKGQYLAQVEKRLLDQKYLDEGFARLRVSLREQIQRECDDLNAEPVFGNIFRFSADNDEKWTVSRIDVNQRVTLKLDGFKHRVTLECEEPIKFSYPIQVLLSGGNWYYVGGKKNEDGHGDDRIDWFLEKLFTALTIGIEK